MDNKELLESFTGIAGIIEAELKTISEKFTNYLACDGSFVVSDKSFLLQQPSYDYIQCLEDSTVSIICPGQVYANPAALKANNLCQNY
jgi:hypothetical protein